MKATFMLALLLLAIAFLTENERRVEAKAEPVVVEILPVSRNPLDPPRCPKVNAAGQLLLNEVAMKADGGDWTHACEYQANS